MYNDWLWFIYNDEFNIAKGTTDPGVYYTKNPLNEQGAFHMVSGFQEKIWTLDKHANKYIALCSRKNCKPQRGWRDTNKDNINNDNKIVSGHFGANWHYTNNDEFIKLASAGCQVTNNIQFFDNSIECAIASEQELFSYMLFEIEEIPTNLKIELGKVA
jgi:hypothetical protein